METLEHFIERTKGTAVDFPNVDHDTNLKGQCVTLVQNYIYSCLGQPYTARGDAKDWIYTYVNEGLGHTSSDQQDGDIIVFPNEGNGYGHIGIWYKNNIYDQNNLRHDNGLAGLCNVFSWDFVTLRPNVSLPKEDKPKENKPKPKDDSFKVGDKVKVKELIDYNGTGLISYDDYYIITELVGDRAVLSAERDGELIVWSAVNISNLIKI